MRNVTIYSDGGCAENPGPGGWAAVLLYKEHRREISGGVPATTNNRMELVAAAEALRALKEPCVVDLYTDSEYLRKGIAEWLDKWMVRGWRTQKRGAVRNVDLWQALASARHRHRVTWHWLKGHAGNVHNERCDELAREEIAKIQRQYSPEQLDQLLRAFADGQTKGVERGTGAHETGHSSRPRSDENV